MTSRSTTAAVALTALSCVLAGCGAKSSSDAGGGADSDTIKVALIPATGGALGQIGIDAVRGWQLAVEEVNAAGGVDGRRVELIEKSTDGDPATTLRAAREAVTKDGAAFISAVVTSPENAALNAQLAGLGAVSLVSLAKDDALIGEQCDRNSFHISHTTGMDINTIAETLEDIPGDKWAIQAVDYATGHTAAEIFRAAAERAGKEIVVEQFAPLGTTDFGTHITKIQGSNADAIFAVELGADGVAFVQQAEQFNLPAKVESVVGLATVNESLFETLGEVVLGYYNTVAYDVEADSELNAAFVEAYTEKFDEQPYFVPADNYLAAQALFAAVEEAGSAEPENVAEVLEDLEFDSIVGPVVMRAEDHQLLRDTYLGQVVAEDGGMKFDIRAQAGPEVTTPKPNPDCGL